jgi:hypothetical protein
MSCDAITLTVGYQKITFTPVCPVLLHVRCASASITLHLQAVQLRIFVILTANNYYSPEKYQKISVCNDYAVPFFSENLNFFCLHRVALHMCLLYALHLANLACNTWTSAEHIFVTFVTLVLFVNTLYFLLL